MLRACNGETSAIIDGDCRLLDMKVCRQAYQAVAIFLTYGNWTFGQTLSWSIKHVICYMG